MRCITTLVGIFTITLLIGLSLSITLTQEKPPSWEVYFSRHGGCPGAII